ncbi:MAG TPA: class F sortase [Actinoplanes sp.]|nr:class F sortase [Actinoplanes sp.]
MRTLPALSIAAPSPTRPAWPRPQRGRRPSTSGLLVLGLVLVGLFAASAALGQAAGANRPDAGSRSARPFGALAASSPTLVIIPALGVRAPVQTVGRTAAGSVEVPPAHRRAVGWLRRGPTPGQPGAAVLVGYANTRTGPATLVHLSRLRPGQRIDVVRRDRRIAVFRVSAIHRSRTIDPPGCRVSDVAARPTLCLVGHGGRWLGPGAGYGDYVIVHAVMTAGRRA